jgi:hypothetical protein
MQTSEARTDWRPADWWNVGVRLLVLLVLLAGATSVVVALNLSTRSNQDLIADLAAGRVSYVEYERGSGDIQWSNQWWQWRTTTFTPQEITQGDSVTDRATLGDVTLQWLQRQVDASGHPIPVHLRDSQRSTWWPSRVVWQPLAVLTTLAWLGTFVVMLGTSRHRYANRWAWVWLFTFGQVGALLYLVLEPRPIWRPRSWSAPTNRTPAGGGTGCLWSILLALAVSLAIAAITAIF